jgi:hypothetical protein
MDSRIESAVAALTVRDIMAVALLCFIACGLVTRGKLILGSEWLAEVNNENCPRVGLDSRKFLRK